MSTAVKVVPPEVSKIVEVLWRHQPDLDHGSGATGRWRCVSLTNGQSCPGIFYTFEEFLTHQATALAEAEIGDTEISAPQELSAAARLAAPPQQDGARHDQDR